ncbi:MAG: hypothetical protein K0Q59_3522 [Paenibacillus sp.]|nr:hypothetical protein [Paenibacillus sp.]
MKPEPSRFEPLKDDRRQREQPQARRDLFDSQPLNQFTTDFGAWKSPFDVETERVEREIRQSGNVHPPEPMPEKEQHPHPYADEARYHGDSGYVEPPRGPQIDLDEVGDMPPGHGRHERFNRAPLLKIVASVTGAVATGVLIGFFVLSMFGDDSAKPGETSGLSNPGKTSASIPVQTKDQAADPSAAKSNGAASATSAATATVPINVAARSYTLLQNGVFSTLQGANEVAAELKKKGLAAFVQPADKYYVYAGVTASRDDALALSQLLMEQKLDLFLKPVALPAVSKMSWSGEQAGVAEQYFAQSDKLIQTILGFSAARLKEKTPAAMDDATMKAITTAHQSWSGVSAAFAAGLGQDQKATVQRWNTAMNTAVTSMNEYKKNASSAFLWEAQTSMMQVLFAQQELLEAVGNPAK